ncbi:MAG TPA: septum formation initiator family protein [Bryobacteraceae bacterium]|nr:septum formation initiator family protein [Bryobacteraceae bacterium]
MSRVLRRVAFFTGLALAGVYGYFALRGPHGIPAVRERWREIRRLEEENANLQQQNKDREARIKKLQESPSEQELEIRKKLKLLRPGETSFILPDAPKQDSSLPAAPAEAK